MDFILPTFILTSQNHAQLRKQLQFISFFKCAFESRHWPATNSSSCYSPKTPYKHFKARLPSKRGWSTCAVGRPKDNSCFAKSLEWMKSIKWRRKCRFKMGEATEMERTMRKMRKRMELLRGRQTKRQQRRKPRLGSNAKSTRRRQQSQLRPSKSSH